MLSDRLTKYFFNIVGQHEDFDIKLNIVRQSLSIIIQSVTKLNSKICRVTAKQSSPWTLVYVSIITVIIKTSKILEDAV